MISVVCVVLFTFLMFLGCASNSNFQSAKSLSKGVLDVYAGLSNIDYTDDSIVDGIDLPSGFFFELGADIGVTDKIDIGIKYTFPTAGFLSGKFTFLGSGKEKGFFSAIGLRGGYTAFPSSDSTSNNRIEFAVPLYLSVFPVEMFGISVIPTYSGRFFNDIDSYYTNLAGGNINISLGKRFHVVAEFSYFRNFHYNWNEMQGGIGFFVEIKDLF